MLAYEQALGKREGEPASMDAMQFRISSSIQREVDLHVEWGRIFQIPLHQCRLLPLFPHEHARRLDEFRPFNQYIIVLFSVLYIFT